jgi:hypothetical protein
LDVTHELGRLEAAALEAMGRRSLERHGQLTPIVAFIERDQLETLDGGPQCAAVYLADNQPGHSRRDRCEHWRSG